jgi:hypothetical protein
MWEAPEFSAGVIGYGVRILYQAEGNGDLLDPSWDPTELTVLGQTQVDLASTVVTIGCRAEGSTLSVCLSVYTIYYIELSVIREDGTDAPMYFYIATTKLDMSSYDHSEVYIFSGDIFVTFVEPIGWMSSGAVGIGSSPFAGAHIESPSRDLVVELHDSTVTSVSVNKLQIVMSHHEFTSTLAQIVSNEFSFTSLSLVYDGGQRSIPMLEFCLLTTHES